jgi:hypothetical protein
MVRSAVVLWVVLATAGCAKDGVALQELQRVRSGDVDVVLLAPEAGLKQGKSSFTLEFRGASDAALVDVGTIRLAASMPMPGMGPMFGDVVAQPPGTPGRYLVSSDLEMAGTWRITVEWTAPPGLGTAAFSRAVD